MTTSLPLPTSISNCFLRPWRAGDEDALVHHGDNPNVARYLVAAFPRPYTLADAHDWIALCEAAPAPLNLAIEFAGAPIGGVGGRLGEGEMRRTMSFGYWLGEAYWGRGIATAVVNAYVPYAFGFGIQRLEAHVYAPNTASARVLDKCGFSMEGRLAQRVVVDDVCLDELMYARLR